MKKELQNWIIDFLRLLQSNPTLEILNTKHKDAQRKLQETAVLRRITSSVNPNELENITKQIEIIQEAIAYFRHCVVTDHHYETLFYWFSSAECKNKNKDLLAVLSWNTHITQNLSYYDAYNQRYYCPVPERVNLIPFGEGYLEEPIKFAAFLLWIFDNFNDAGFARFVARASLFRKFYIANLPITSEETIMDTTNLPYRLLLKLIEPSDQQNDCLAIFVATIKQIPGCIIGRTINKPILGQDEMGNKTKGYQSESISGELFFHTDVIRVGSYRIQNEANDGSIVDFRNYSANQIEALYHLFKLPILIKLLNVHGNYNKNIFQFLVQNFFYKIYPELFQFILHSSTQREENNYYLPLEYLINIANNIPSSLDIDFVKKNMSIFYFLSYMDYESFNPIYIKLFQYFDNLINIFMEEKLSNTLTTKEIILLLKLVKHLNIQHYLVIENYKQTIYQKLFYQHPGVAKEIFRRNNDHFLLNDDLDDLDDLKKLFQYCQNETNNLQTALSCAFLIRKNFIEMMDKWQEQSAQRQVLSEQKSWGSRHHYNTNSHYPINTLELRALFIEFYWRSEENKELFSFDPVWGNVLENILEKDRMEFKKGILSEALFYIQDADLLSEIFKQFIQVCSKKINWEKIIYIRNDLGKYFLQHVMNIEKNDRLVETIFEYWNTAMISSVAVVQNLEKALNDVLSISNQCDHTNPLYTKIAVYAANIIKNMIHLNQLMNNSITVKANIFLNKILILFLTTENAAAINELNKQYGSTPFPAYIFPELIKILDEMNQLKTLDIRIWNELMHALLNGFLKNDQPNQKLSLEDANKIIDVNKVLCDSIQYERTHIVILLLERIKWEKSMISENLIYFLVSRHETTRADSLLLLMNDSQEKVSMMQKIEEMARQQNNVYVTQYCSKKSSCTKPHCLFLKKRYPDNPPEIGTRVQPPMKQ